MVEIVTAEALSSIVKENGTVVVDVFAGWCPPCQRMVPVIDALAKKHPEYGVVKVDADANGGFCREMEIRYIPTLIVYREGKVVGRRSGFAPLEELEDWIKSAGDGEVAKTGV